MSKHNRERRYRGHPSIPEGTVVRLDSSVPVVSPLLDVPADERIRIARIVHRAVDLVKSSERFGYCTLQALAGNMILDRWKLVECKMQVGSLWLAPDPSDLGLVLHIDAEKPESLMTGEFHAWLGDRHGAQIDFSARDWPKMFGSDRIAETPEPLNYRREPLDYLWAAHNALPTGVRYQANAALTHRFHDFFAEWPGLKDFHDLVRKLYKYGVPE